MPSRLRGFSLVEVLVATALGAALTGVAAFVFTSSQALFLRTDTKVSTTLRLRAATDLMRHDLSYADPTADMEFFRDADGDGFYSPGEEAQDPGPSQSGYSANTEGYNHALTVCTATYGGTESAPELRSDALYLRVDSGAQPPLLVEYRLLHAAYGRTDLVRRVGRLDPEREAVTYTTEVLVSDVLELTFEFYLPGHGWLDAVSAQTSLGLRPVVARDDGVVVEMLLEGQGRVRAGENVLRVAASAGLRTLEPGDGIQLMRPDSEGNPTRGRYTVADVRGDAELSISFVERLEKSSVDADVRYRALLVPTAIRARVTLRSTHHRTATSTESVFALN